ncbi:TetR/AcrR family transcriptional regulator [Streptomyces sp. NBC_01288]|uniref:TetR/AcrR family transcriptional regulator n=1 Tax=Streptomyces sp. NBC_01288 TaxID=2903814 RepID=UPI002E0F96DE|nr:TetR/AcrR family transcriptional regulator [Streptomyces sp. NBC_01288]
MTEEAWSYRQRAAETKRKRTWEQVISGTLALYGELPEGDFTRDEIAKASGVGVATVHNHFRTKYGVLSRVYQRLLSPAVEWLKCELHPPRAADDKDPLRASARYVDALIGYIYLVVKTSDDHRALTSSMVRSYFEAQSEQTERFRLADYDQLSLAETINRGINAILTGMLMQNVFEKEKVGHFEFFFEDPDVMSSYHARAILLTVYHSLSGVNDDGMPARVTEQVGKLLLSGIGVSVSKDVILQRIPSAIQKANLWYDKKKRSGWLD